MKAKVLPNRLLLLACLDYDPLTGGLTWKVRPEWTFNSNPLRNPEHVANVWNSAWAGKPALASLSKNGYLRGTLNGEFYYAHRIIWKMLHGTEPEDIDHDDGVRTNNRPFNLFSRSRSDNLKNRALSSNNTSGYHGISYSKRHNLWNVSIYDNGNKIHLGWFAELGDAVATRKEAEILFGYNPNHGRNA